MIIKDKIKKSFFDILSPPFIWKEASPNLLNVPKKYYTKHLFSKQEININLIQIKTHMLINIIKIVISKGESHMKVIFLDFNGVLDTYDNMDEINPDNLNRLKHIVDETNSKIVISS